MENVFLVVVVVQLEEAEKEAKLEASFHIHFSPLKRHFLSLC
jgi:hypothetical protein